MKHLIKVNKIFNFCLVLFLLNCSDNNTPETSIKREPVFDTIFTITADLETTPVQGLSDADAADDPAIWVHPIDPAKSLIYGTNKKLGLGAYDLNGNEVLFYKTGKINNVDVAYNYSFKAENIDLVVATNRSHNIIDLYKINKNTGELLYLLKDTVRSKVDDVYGVCFYRSKKTGNYFVFVSGKNGQVEQYLIETTGDFLTLKLNRVIKIKTQIEGLVADHYHGYLYVGEEEQGIWKIGAEPTDTGKVLIKYSSEFDNKNIKYDIEGLTIYYSSLTEGYLFASSQGNNTYAIFDRIDNQYLGSFGIVDGEFDRVEETDGIDVINQDLGNRFPNGIFVVQDGLNKNGSIALPQNFKIIDFKKISELFNPELVFNNKLKIRDLFK
jgi:3-phytase